MTGDPYAAAFAVLTGAMDDLTERRDRGAKLTDLVVLAVTEEDGDAEHFLNGLSVGVSQRIGTLRWFTLRAEHWLTREWDGDDEP